MESLRVITVEEHFHHPEVSAEVRALSGPLPVTPDEGFATFVQDEFMPDQDSAERLGGSRLAHMDKAGIDVQVVSHGAFSPTNLDRPEAVDLCRRVNDRLALQISEHPTRFRGFATIPLHDPAAAADEMKRCVHELGFVGTLITGTCGGRFLDDERFDPVLSAAEAVDLPIYVHPGFPDNSAVAGYYAGNWPAAVQFTFATHGFGWHMEAGVHILRLILSGALDRHPGLKLLSGHWGEFAAGWLDRFDGTFAKTRYLERDVSDYYRDHVWITPSGMYTHNQLNYLLGEVGADRIIHSEDFPYLVRDDVAGFLADADLPDDQRHAIAHRNAEQLLRI
ncbi:amidohydrolase family protein [Amycolatopsis endophytica]|uniref:Amidohydrolase-related domain-containing protein n=1 Tax=Amycolatopsis endophytica TaxID=860233 RepID=A0A853AX96_9PSEU|nr:amidohydrolase family protein [Amycolatopsis endophytica]NYI87292.1 hypothetical protein [Amycolatopsis endophytica]